MISKATVKYLRVSPRKTRAVVSLIKGKYVDEALDILNSINKKSAPLLAKLLNSAIANAKRLPNVQQENLYISDIFVNGGPSLKRYKAQALGRATMIKRRTSHIVAELDMKELPPLKEAKKVAKAKKEKPVVKKTIDQRLKTKGAKKAKTEEKTEKKSVQKGAESGA